MKDRLRLAVAALDDAANPDARIQLLERERQRLCDSTECADTDEECNLRSKQVWEVERQIFATPATTASGLLIKLRLVRAEADADGGFNGEYEGLKSLSRDLERMSGIAAYSTENKTTSGDGAAIAAEWRDALAALDTIATETPPEDAEQIEERFANADHALLAYRGLDCADVVRIQAEQCQQALTDEAEGRGLDAIEQCLVANSYALASLVGRQDRTG